MRNLMSALLIIVSVPCLGQAYLTDDNFHDHMESRGAFGDDDNSIVIVEFWISWNDANSLENWDKIKSAEYYRVDVGTSLDLKNKYDIMIAPTLIVFVDGVEYERFKAGLDMKCPVTVAEIESSLIEIKRSISF